MDSILDPPGLPFGSLLAPKMAETSLGIPLGPARSHSRLLFFGLQAPQERSKSPSRPLQEASRSPRCSKRPPGSHLAPNFLQFWSHLSWKTELWKLFGLPPAALWESFQQYCKTAVLQACAGPATGAQRHLDNTIHHLRLKLGLS